MNPLISIQILNWNRADETQRAIRSAIAQSYSPKEIVLVDNGSNDNSVALTRKNFPQVKIVELDLNFGCPGGRNRGIDHCDGDFIFYLDNDGVLHNKAVEHAFRTIHSDEAIGIVTGIVYDFDNPDEIDPLCLIRNDIRYYYKEFQGGISLHRKSIYRDIGLYPDHFMYGAEETYLSIRLADSPYRIVKDESVVLWHKRSETARDRTQEIVFGYYNKLYIAMTLYPWPKSWLFLAYFIIVYPYYSIRDNVFKTFVKSYLGKLLKTLKLSIKGRDPISKEAYRKFRFYQIDEKF